MKIDRTGCSRIVILTRRWALKIPAFIDSSNRWSWRTFCEGMLANMQEVAFSRAEWPELCPVRFHLPLGILSVMPKVRLLTDEEFCAMDFKAFTEKENYYVPVEKKANSFGWLNEKVVVIDYGN